MVGKATREPQISLWLTTTYSRAGATTSMDGKMKSLETCVLCWTKHFEPQGQPPWQAGASLVVVSCLQCIMGSNHWHQHTDSCCLEPEIIPNHVIIVDKFCPCLKGVVLLPCWYHLVWYCVTSTGLSAGREAQHTQIVMSVVLPQRQLCWSGLLVI